MKLIYNKVVVNLGDNEYILINTLNGKINLLNRNEYIIFKKWDGCDKIGPEDKEEATLYHALLTDGYLVKDVNEESERKESILSYLRNTHLKQRNKFFAITFIPTYECNFRCSYCYEAGNVSYDNQMPKEMVDAALAITDDKTLTEVQLFGGEPLLPKNREIVEHIFSRCKDKRFQIVTNGYTLLDYIDILAGHNFRHIQVTLDGGLETHNRKRYLYDGTPTFVRIIEGIEACLAKKIPIHIRMNVEECNIEECINLRDDLLGKWREFESIISFELAPLFQLGSESRQYIIERLTEEDANKPLDEFTKANSILASFRPIIDYFLTGKQPKPTYAFCHAHGGNVFVDSLGDIYTCILSLGQKELSVGTYYPEVKWKENSILMRNIENIPACLNCKYALICGGGCPMLLDGYENVFRPVCDETKRDIHTLIPYFYNTKRLREGEGA